MSSGFSLLPKQILQMQEEQEVEKQPEGFETLSPEIMGLGEQEQEDVQPSLTRKISLLGTDVASTVLGFGGSLLEQASREMQSVFALTTDGKQPGETFVQAFQRGQKEAEPLSHPLPTKRGVTEFFSNLTGSDLTPQSVTEEDFVAKYGPMTSGALLGSIAGPFGASLGAFGGLAGSAGGKLARELGAPEEIARTVEGGLGSIPGFIRPPVAARVPSPATKEGKIAQRIFKVKPEQVRKDIIQAGKDLDVPLPASAVVDNELVQMMEAKLAQSGLTGDALRQSKEGFIRGVTRNVNEAVESIADRSFSDRMLAGETLQNKLVAARDAHREIHTSLYNEADAAIRSTDLADVTPLTKALKVARKKLEVSKKPSAAETQALNEVNALEQAITENQVVLYDSKGRPMTPAAKQQMTAKETAATYRSLNDTIKFETQGGPDKVLMDVRQALSDMLDEYGKKNPEYLRLKKAADKQFQEHVNLYRNKNVDRAIFAENPETITKQFTSPGKIQQLEDAFEILGADGQQTVNQFKRFELERALLDSVIDSQTGNVQIGRLRQKIKGSDAYDKLVAFAGEDQANRIVKVSKLADAVERSSNRFLNTSQTATAMQDIAVMGYALKQVLVGLKTGSALPLIKAGFGVKSPKIMADLMASPEFVTALEDLAQPKSLNNADIFRSRYATVAELLSREIDKQNQQ